MKEETGMPTPAKHRITDSETGVTTEFDMTWNDIRGLRDAWLSDSDLWMLSDRYASLTSALQTELTTYRQALRDLPTSTADSADAEFPDKPSWLV